MKLAEPLVQVRGADVSLQWGHGACPYRPHVLPASLVALGDKSHDNHTRRSEWSCDSHLTAKGDNAVPDGELAVGGLDV